MIYLTFTVWLFLSALVARGLQRLWSRMLQPAWIDWVLLPGTVIGEMSYMFGCLITGGQVNRAKLLELPALRGARRGGVAADGQAKTQSKPRLAGLGPIDGVAASMLACLAAIVLLCSALGKSVVVEFITGDGLLASASLPRSLPGRWDALWDQMEVQLELARRTYETWGRLDLLDWRQVLFVYLTVCLSVRIAPPGRPLRTILVAAAAMALLVAAAGLIVGIGGRSIMEKLWPVLTYVWSTLLALLAATLLVRGAVGLVDGIRRRPT